MADLRKERERRQQDHAVRLAESRPLLDRSIPLGFPPVADRVEINAYYREKHQRGQYGQFFPLHHIRTPG